jgi:hypothetical protein
MSHVFGHAVKHAFEHSKSMHKVGVGKSPLVAFVAGFLFGPFGLGLYLRSWADCFIPLTLIIIGSVFTAGIATPLLWMLCGAWGWVRVSNSNKPDEFPAA